jgi:hypothetical protein
MMMGKLYTGVVLVAISLTASQLAAQSCMPVDSTRAMPLVETKVLVASTDPKDVTTRQDLRIPATDSSGVVAVSDTKICDKVLTAFKATLDPSIPPPTQLFVMKVGNVYLALHITGGNDPTDIYRVVSRQYAILSRFAK